MKKALILIMTLSMLTACSNTKQSETIDSIPITAENVTIENNVNLPFIVDSWDKIRMMSPAIAPYLMELTEDKIRQLSDAIKSSSWDEIDETTPIPDGEAYSVFIYNAGKPFRLTFYGDYTVDYEQENIVHKYTVNDAALRRTVAEIVNCDNVYDYLIPCEIENITSEGVWEDNSSCYIEVCQNYMKDNYTEKEIDTITNWESPKIEQANLPEQYAVIGSYNTVENSSDFYAVTFFTTEDALLGPITFYLNKQGNILGQAFRE